MSWLLTVKNITKILRLRFDHSFAVERLKMLSVALRLSF